MNVKVTLIHKSAGERVIYVGLYDEWLNCDLMRNEAYKNAIVSGDCKLLVEGISEEEKNKMIEQMEFELSVSNDCKMNKWKVEA